MSSITLGQNDYRMHILPHIIISIAEIFGIFAIGALCRRWDYIREEELNRFSRLIFDVLIPMLIFSSVIKNLEANSFRELWMLPLLGFGFMLFGFICGLALKWGLRNRSPERVGTFLNFCAVNNYGFLPIIILTNTWGEKALPFLFILNIGSNIGFWTLGPLALSHGSLRSAAKNILSPTLVTIVVALTICLSGLRPYVPELALNISSALGRTAIPLILLVIGASLYRTPEVFKHKWDITWVCLCRLLIIPVATLAILIILPIPPEIMRIAAVVAIMPTSVSSVIMTRRYGGAPHFASQAALVTTSASLATIPLLMYLASLFGEIF